MKPLFGVHTCTVVVVVLLSTLPVLAGAQNQSLPYELSLDKIVGTTLHLPSYIESLQKLQEIETRAATHQDLVVRWNSLPGWGTARLKKKDVEGVALADDFTLTSRKEYQKGPALSGGLSLSREQLVILGVSSSNEIRSVDVILDPRVSWGEGFGPDTVSREDFVQPVANVRVRIPDDSAIVKIEFFKPDFENGAWVVKQVGTLVLNSTHA